MAESSRGVIVELERRVLQVLCGGSPDTTVRDRAKGLLANYKWREPSHEVIFEVLISLPSNNPELMREQLPSRLTRRGFPDVEWEKIFAAPNLTKEQAEGLVLKLAEANRI